MIRTLETVVLAMFCCNTETATQREGPESNNAEVSPDRVGATYGRGQVGHVGSRGGFRRTGARSIRRLPGQSLPFLRNVFCLIS